MALVYHGADTTLSAIQKMWQIKESGPVLLYEGSVQTLQFNPVTGNPVYIKADEDKWLTVELDQGQEKPLYEQCFHGDHTWDLYRYDTDTLYKWPISAAVTPAYDLGLVNIGRSIYLYRGWEGDVYNDDYDEDYIKNLLQIELTDTYAPAVPNGAPAWVSEYMGMLYRQRFSRYSVDEIVDLDELNFLNLTVLDLIGTDSIPILYCYGIKGSMEKYYYYLYDAGFTKPVMGEIFSRAPMGMGATLYQDETGNVLLRSYDEGGFIGWQTLTDDGLESLFDSGYYDMNGESAYCNGRILSLEEWDGTPEDWLDEQTDAALAQYGYGPRSSMTELTGTTYTLPVKQATWPELEAILIDIFCQHAQSIGQWGA